MVANIQTVYRPAVPAERCYLVEVLLWHAFGRFPEEMRLPGMVKDWRFSEDVLEDYQAPHPGGFILSPEECGYASIPPDPLGRARAQGLELKRPEFYPEALYVVEVLSGKESPGYKILQYDYELSKALHERFDDWQQAFNDYVDQFAAEIILQLRKGKLKAWGTKLPFSDRNAVYKFLSFKNIVLEDLDVIEVPPDLWVTKSVNWQESSLINAKRAFIWVHLDTSAVLDHFPAKRKLEGVNPGILPIGAAVTTTPTIPNAPSGSKRGRPPLPWERFHVEVARLFRDGEMPTKQDSAIVHFITWFKKEMGEDASRSAIRERLKVYYDELVWKKTEK